MKMQVVYKLFVLAFLAVLFQSRSNGPGAVQGLQVTGAPGSAGSVGTCANPGCHSSGAFSPSLSIQLLENGQPVNAYKPEKVYELRIVNTPGSGMPAAYGFQAVALDGQNSQAGGWVEVPAHMHTVTLSSREYIEHDFPQEDSGTFVMKWLAPEPGTGPVTFYSASNAVNLNGSSSGDGTASSTLMVEEDMSSSTSEPEGILAGLRVFPNPVRQTLQATVEVNRSGEYRFRLMRLDGVQVREWPAQLQPGANELQFDLGGLPPGLFLLQLYGQGPLGSTRVLKM